MAVEQLAGVGAVAPQPPLPSRPIGVPGPAPGFDDAVVRGLQGVSRLEHTADASAVSFATGGPTSVHEVMTSTAQSQLAVEALVAVRNRAVEAYTEIMRLQV